MTALSGLWKAPQIDENRRKCSKPPAWDRGCHVLARDSSNPAKSEKFFDLAGFEKSDGKREIQEARQACWLKIDIFDVISCFSAKLKKYPK